MDVARADTVDAELDRLISKRASQDRRPDPDEEHDRWQGSVERYHQRRREEHRWEWVRHFDRMAAGHASISEDYRRRADELVEISRTRPREEMALRASPHSPSRSDPEQREQSVAENYKPDT
jgi:hypothetical protein